MRSSSMRPTFRFSSVWMLLFAGVTYLAACTAPPNSPSATDSAETASSAPRGGTCLGQGEGWCTSAPCHLPDGGLEHLPCCAGLQEVETYESNSIERDRKCLASKGGRVSCVACGNGVCERGENKCNCPSDCGSL